MNIKRTTTPIIKRADSDKMKHKTINKCSHGRQESALKSGSTHSLDRSH